MKQIFSKFNIWLLFSQFSTRVCSNQHEFILVWHANINDMYHMKGQVTLFLSNIITVTENLISVTKVWFYHMTSHIFINFDLMSPFNHNKHYCLGYLTVLRPVLPVTLWWICISGCLGLTVQLSLLQDLLSMMTLHIYCFYVYAARFGYTIYICLFISLYF